MGKWTWTSLMLQIQEWPLPVNQDPWEKMVVKWTWTSPMLQIQELLLPATKWEKVDQRTPIPMLQIQELPSPMIQDPWEKKMVVVKMGCPVKMKELPSPMNLWEKMVMLLIQLRVRFLLQTTSSVPEEIVLANITAPQTCNVATAPHHVQVVVMMVPILLIHPKLKLKLQLQLILIVTLLQIQELPSPKTEVKMLLIYLPVLLRSSLLLFSCLRSLVLLSAQLCIFRKEINLLDESNTCMVWYGKEVRE